MLPPIRSWTIRAVGAASCMAFSHSLVTAAENSSRARSATLTTSAASMRSASGSIRSTVREHGWTSMVLRMSSIDSMSGRAAGSFAAAAPSASGTSCLTRLPTKSCTSWSASIRSVRFLRSAAGMATPLSDTCIRHSSGAERSMTASAGSGGVESGSPQAPPAKIPPRSIRNCCKSIGAASLTNGRGMG